MLSLAPLFLLGHITEISLLITLTIFTQVNTKTRMVFWCCKKMWVLLEVYFKMVTSVCLNLTQTYLVYWIGYAQAPHSMSYSFCPIFVISQDSIYKIQFLD